MIIDHSGYIRFAFDPVAHKRTITRVEAAIRRLQEVLGFDAIAFRGFSGAMIAGPVSYLTGIPMICVRKEAETSHGNAVEGPSAVDIKSYLILDDLIGSGNTIQAIVKGIKHAALADNTAAPKCVGIALYNGDGEDRFTDKLHNLDLKVYILSD